MSLTLLETGVYAWMAASPAVGYPNAGVVIDHDGITVIDSLATPAQAAPFAAEVDALGSPLKRVVLTSGHIEFVGGTARFRLAAVYGSPMTSAHLDEPPNIPAYQAFMPELAHEFADLETRGVTHTVDAPAMLTPALEVRLAGGNTPQNVIVRAPGAGVVYAGGACSFGVTPLGFQADFESWIATLDALAQLPDRIVPGHGPVGAARDVIDLRAYLEACVACDGAGPLPAGPWDTWANRELDAINIERAALLARGEDRVPSTMLKAIGLDDG